MEYDLIINNGRVIDSETHLDAIRNVGVRNGRIEVVTEEKITGKQIIASGFVVAPGFIDPHIHAFDAYGNKFLVRDGVTTALELGAWPLEAFYTEKAGKWPLNYGAAAGHPFARVFVMHGVDCEGTGLYSGCVEESLGDGTNWNQKQATPEQVKAIVGKTGGGRARRRARNRLPDRVLLGRQQRRGHEGRRDYRSLWRVHHQPCPLPGRRSRGAGSLQSRRCWPSRS